VRAGRGRVGEAGENPEVPYEGPPPGCAAGDGTRTGSAPLTARSIITCPEGGETIPPTGEGE
jgi:hypothetical protein